MDIETRSTIFLADKYFRDKIDKIVLYGTGGHLYNLSREIYNPRGGFCYLLTAWALLGLGPEDTRVCGEVDVFTHDGQLARKGYKHAWVEFQVKDNYLVYDPLYDFVIPRDLYYEICHPGKITSRKTWREILKQYLNKRYAFQVDEETWQFKSEKETSYDKDEMNGYVFNALQKGRIHGWYLKDDGHIEAFIAYDPRYR